MLRRFSEPAKDKQDAPPRAGGAATETTAKEGTEMMDKQRDLNAAPAGAGGELNALLGRGSEFDGKLAFEGTVRIDGTFSGEITTSDMLIVGESARVSAEIRCGTIVVNGEITGNIHASQSVELHKPARVKGDISTPSLMIERGVVFEGRSQMEQAESSSKIFQMPKSAAEAD